MRVSELVERSGVPLPTIKYYLRERVLMAGEPTSATQAQYGEQHVRRLALIKALAGAGLPIGKIRTIVDLVDDPGDQILRALGQAVGALPPYADAEDEPADYPRARRLIERLGQYYNPKYPAVAQLERALRAAEEVGLPMTDRRIEAYGKAIMAIAELDGELMPTESTSAAIEYAVLLSAIHEPVITAMRRLAHQDVASRRFPLSATDSLEDTR